MVTALSHKNHRLLPLAIGVAMIIVQVRLPASSFTDAASPDTCEGPWVAVEGLRRIFFVALAVDVGLLAALVVQGNVQARAFTVSAVP